MTKVFIGGSRKMGRLNEAIRKRTENIIDNGFGVLIGDANGADKAIQKYLAERQYQNVLVFCTGNHCRNNLGHWETRNIKADQEKRDSQYYTVKDLVMSDEADYGFMLWDGESKGTLNNILNLLERGKKVLVYFSPGKDFVTLRTPSEMEALLERCSTEIVDALERKLQLRQRLESQQGQLKLA